MEKLGIYGGSFSPIHIGHMAAAYAFKTELSLDRLLIIPAAVPPHKILIDSTSPKDRFEMCRIAFEGADGISVSDIELKREGKSYTYDTITELKAPDLSIYMLCGTDMILTFEKWYRFEDILKNVTLAYVRRENDKSSAEKLSTVCDRLTERYGAKIIPIKITRNAALMCGFADIYKSSRELSRINIGVSSTIVREKIRSGADVSAVVHPDVLRYIKSHDLYSE